jgi:eukaryotic-like serine/threonine-protein kinase
VLWMSLVLLLVALLSALVAMRLAIHGREVTVPDLQGKSPAEARRMAEDSGLTADVEREYYSATFPEGTVLSQTPAAGTIVRSGWELRLAVSLGPQRVAIPPVIGQSQRAAAITIAQRGLSLGVTANMELPDATADEVIAQDPPPNATDASAPKISLLVSQKSQPQTFVMPSFVGQPLGSVTITLKDAGLCVGKVTVAQVAAVQTPQNAAPITPAATPAPSASLAANTPPANPSPASLVVSQDPAPGAQVAAGSSINFVVR